MRIPAFTLALGFAIGLAIRPAAAQEIPHGQTKLPGPALSPQQAMAAMELPQGFSVSLVASEPNLINPTAFTFDDRGRIWVCESVEYPRRSPGAGQDRVKILEDTDGDGLIDKTTVFADGLNIPAGIVHGNGGVYVSNSPDILFLQDTDGDGKADKREVILTGFGRFDTHELPNSLTWGPDGWLYGMNGVFNSSQVKDPATGKIYDFTCGIWRYHPPTKRFELFCEGTSNPWGLDYNRQGDWFISACVIDHLWHMTQSGYYHRQGGPYPPLTVPIRSITTERHQAAAYAGLCIYDANVFPEAYRGQMLMGNLHGSAINRDVLSDDGATYVQHNAKEGDFIQANDAWFMPVSQKIGPDGCLYIMDWYDRYHCYQDANRDSPGLDRGKGRIYRVAYGDAPRAKPFDLSKLSQDELVQRLDDPNVWYRRHAQRILNEKFNESLIPHLKKMVLGPAGSHNGQMHALWLLVSQNALDAPFQIQAMECADPVIRNWAVRAVGNAGKAETPVYEKLKQMAADPSPDVRVQVPIAAGRLTSNDPLPILFAMLDNAANSQDKLIPHILYNNLLPLARTRGKEILAYLDSHADAEKAFGETAAKWIREAIDATGRSPAEIVAALSPVLKAPKQDPGKTRRALQSVIDALTTAGVAADARGKLFDENARTAIGRLVKENQDSTDPATVVALWWNDPAAIARARNLIGDGNAEPALRATLLRALSQSRDAQNANAFLALIKDSSAPILLRQEALNGLGEMNAPDETRQVGLLYGGLPPDLRPMAVTALTRSPSGANALLDAISQKQVPLGDVNANHVRSINALGDKALSERITKLWGVVKTERDPERMKVVEQMRKVVQSRSGDVIRGQAVFTKVCAQCHTIYGKGGNVGPDLTGVGRDDTTAILTNIIDPNLVIGAGYFANVARTKKGQVFTGLLVEQSDQRIVLKDGTKTEIIPRAELDRLVVQNISMMPEGLEKSMTEQEFTDLVSFLLTKRDPAQKN